LVSQICSGMAFGKYTHVELVLLDLETMKTKMEGIKMEVEDCCFDIVDSVSVTSDMEEAFTGIDYAILVGGFPRQPGMDRADLLKRNLPIFKAQAEALDKYSKKSVKVLVVANPANLNAMICMKNAKSIDCRNFMCLTALDANRLHSQVKMAIPIAEYEQIVKKQPELCSRMTVFGDHSNTMVPFVDKKCPLKDHLTAEQLESIQKEVIGRGAAVLNSQGASSAQSAGKAICDHLSAWHNGTKPNTWATMGVLFDENPYGFSQKSLISSSPVHINSKGEWSFVEDIEICEPERTQIEKSLMGIEDGWKDVKKILDR